ncbi:MAG: aminotransferase class IV, partial [Clostridia bacterium]|nr:aminotransferase class IV [Clostridia bacterium]
GINPVKIFVEQKYVRAVRGGYGFTKTGGNYSASLKSQEEAEEQGYSQVLWLDGVERKYIEEVGTMNVMFKIGGEVVTPSLEGSILGGITRRSCIELLKSWGEPVVERKLALAEVVEAAHNGTLEEAFGTGTAAVISPIGELIVGDEHIVINEGKIGPTAQKLYDNIVGIQNGLVEDKLGWIVPVK